MKYFQENVKVNIEKNLTLQFSARGFCILKEKNHGILLNDHNIGDTKHFVLLNMTSIYIWTLKLQCLRIPEVISNANTILIALNGCSLTFAFSQLLRFHILTSLMRGKVVSCLENYLFISSLSWVTETFTELCNTSREAPSFSDL